MGAFLASSKTNILGVLILLCGGTNYSGLLPEKYNQLLMLVCETLTAFGLLAAKDANVTNSPTPVVAHVTPPESMLPPAPTVTVTTTPGTVK